MKKSLILLLIIFIYISYAQSIPKEIANYYYQVLLEKWQKNIDNQKQIATGIIESKNYIGVKKAADIAVKAAKEYYNFESKIHISFDIEEKYYLILIQGLQNEKEQVWVLISKENGKVLSMHNDEIKPYEKTPMKWTAKELAYQDSIDNSRYSSILRKLKLHGIKQYDVKIPKISSNIIGDYIDSVMAANVAASIVAELYDSVTVPIMVKSMGNSKEHWMVYCLTIQADIKKNEYCKRLKIGRKDVIGEFFGFPSCPRMFIILISRKSGQVLFVN